MDTLRLVEVAGDGALVLMTGDGRRFSLAVDEQVRSAVRRSRNGTQETSTAGDRPGPREVQARIRAGADAEQVAAQTGLDVDYVRRFEGPVLAERAHVAELGRATAVDRGGDPTLSLERVVLDVLLGEGHDVDDVSWDSRRSDGTRWQVLALWRTDSGRTEATWSFDTATRSLEPVDAEAERLTGVERRRRLSAVRENVFDVERPVPSSSRGGTVELLDALARQRGRRPAARAVEPATVEPATVEPAAVGPDPLGPGAEGDRAADGVADGRAGDGTVLTEDVVDASDGDGPAGDPGAASDDAADPATEAADQGTTRPDDLEDSDGQQEDASEAPARASGEELRVVPVRSRPDAVETQDQVSIEPDLLSDLQLDTRPSPRTGAPRPAASASADRRSKRRRSSVPSWDEIVFGAKRDGT